MTFTILGQPGVLGTQESSVALKYTNDNIQLQYSIIVSFYHDMPHASVVHTAVILSVHLSGVLNL